MIRLRAAFFSCKMSGTTLAILALISCFMVNAQQLPPHSKVATITSASGSISSPALKDLALPALDQEYVLLSLESEFEIRALLSKGVKIETTFDRLSAIANVKSLKDAGLNLLLNRAKPVNFLWKLSDNLWNRNLKGYRQYSIKTAAFNQTLQLIESSGLTAQFRSGFIIVEGDLSAIMTDLLLDPNVTYVGLESFSPKEESDVLDLYLGPNKINKVHHDFPALNGEGMVISIKERLYNTSDIDLIGRHVPSPLSSPDSTTHATDMATIAAGAGNSFITGRGVATHANITSSDFSNLFPDADADYHTLAAYVQNHSYGTVVENFYGSLAAAYDESAQRNPTVLHVFSSGNEGLATATSGSYVSAPGFSNLTGNSKAAKNVLVIGAVDTTGNEISFASRGPAYDGRIKPDLVAYSSSGTSNAAALVSGTALLLQQIYKSTHNAFPPSALLKALLITAADDVGSPGVDYSTGYGNLNASRSISNLKAARYFSGSIAQNEIKTFDIPVPMGSKNLKVTLVWNDPAASVNASAALVNNLDLEVHGSAGPFKPWVLDPSPNTSSLKKSATRGVDNLNNVEQVSIAAVSNEVYTISVKGTSLASASQEFFIAYQWDQADSFEWTYPTGSDNFPYNGETGTYFFWKSTLNELTGDLEVSTDQGASWTTIRKDVLLSSGSYRWEHPFDYNTVALARMKINGKFFVTEQFTISRPSVPTVAFNCADSTLLQWSKMPGVQRYQIEQLVGRYLTPREEITDTARVIRDREISNFAIQPLLSGGKLLLRSRTVNVNTFGSGCFAGSFVDEEISDNGILFRLDLPTLYGIESVSFQLLEKGSYQTLETLDPQSQTIRYFHSDPPQGTNRYRALIVLSNGQEIFTNTLEVFYLTKIPFAIFPNPVTIPMEINIFSGKFAVVNFRFELMQADGRLVKSTNLSSDREFLSTEGLTPGLYFYTIEGEAGRFNGKLVLK